MAFRHGRETKVIINTANLTSYLNEAATTSEVDTGQTTTFGQTAHSYVVGMQDGSVSLSGLFDGAVGAIDDEISSTLGVDNAGSFFIFPHGDTGPGARVSFGGGEVTSYEITSPVTDVVSLSMELSADNGVSNGVSLGTQGTGTGLQVIDFGDGTINNPSVDMGVASSNGAIAQVHVLDNTLNGNLVVKIQDSPDNSAWSDLITFSAVSGGSDVFEFQVVDGAVGRYLRATFSESAAAGSASVAVGIKRL